MAKTKGAQVQRTLTAMLVVDDCEKAIAFYEQAFDAARIPPCLTGPDGALVHAELWIGDSVLMLAPATERDPSPLALGGSPSRVAITVEDADEVFERAVGAGAEVAIPLDDQFYGHRSGRLRDPFGHLWIVGQVLEDLTEAEMQARCDALFGTK